MSKREEFNSAMKEAMKNKDSIGLATIRLIIAAMKDRDIAARGKGNTDGIDDAEILSMLQSMIKQRQESVKMYEQGGRNDLVAQEKAEITVIEKFLPKQMSDSEMEIAVAGIIADIGAKEIKDMGRVMAALKTRYAGQMDMGKAGGVVKGKLG